MFHSPNRAQTRNNSSTSPRNSNFTGKPHNSAAKRRNSTQSSEKSRNLGRAASNSPRTSSLMSSSSAEADLLRSEIAELKNLLNFAMNSNNSAEASRLAGEITDKNSQLNQKEMERNREEKALQGVLEKLSKIKQLITGKINELAALQHKFYQYIRQPQAQLYPFPAINYSNNQQNQGNNTSNPFGSLMSSISSTFSNNSTNSSLSLPDTEQELVPRLWKSIKEAQLTLEQQMSAADMLDTEGLTGSLLAGVKQQRKDTVQLIQQQLKYVDEFLKHAENLKNLMEFLKLNHVSQFQEHNNNNNNSHPHHQHNSHGHNSTSHNHRMS
jgi:hypothetical protein